MIKKVELSLSPREYANPEEYRAYIARQLKVNPSDIHEYSLFRRSIDARNQRLKVNLSFEVGLGQKLPQPESMEYHAKNVEHSKRVLIIGSGPSGLFAALRLLELGLKPIIIERGKDVSSRKKDIALLNRNQAFSSDSNYCFGEGGAGTFSDGKLYTRSKKRGDINRFLDLLYFFGAPEQVIIDAHPHIGSDKLPGVIRNIREFIIEHGGEFHFGTKLTDINLKSGKIESIQTAQGEQFHAEAYLLATGHSASDIYYLLDRKKILIEPKGFAMGVRIEHPQDLIDDIQYHLRGKENNYLPAASYTLRRRVGERGVYSFCMCPGGYIVPAGSAEDEMVVNGMSPSKRNSPFANSGLVVEIRPEDIQAGSALDVLSFQKELEHQAYLNGGSGMVAPAQTLSDFVRGKLSPYLPPSSYIPGIISSPLHFWLPEIIREPLKEALKNFGQRMRGFVSQESLMLGVESRTSSPLRIPRDKETYQHIQIENLYPCGEGAGYAGGILSSAIDGHNAASAMAQQLK